MSKTVDLLGQQAEYYLNHTCETIDKKLIHVPGPDAIEIGRASCRERV